MDRRPPQRNEGKVGTWSTKPRLPSGEKRMNLREYHSRNEPTGGLRKRLNIAGVPTLVTIARPGPTRDTMPIRSKASASRAHRRKEKYCMGCKRVAEHRANQCPAQGFWS
jgi:hypothetical protein